MIPRSIRSVRALLALVLALGAPGSVEAQQFVDAHLSAGAAVMRSDVEGALLWGWYADGMKSLAPDTAIVADVSGSYGPEQEPIGSERWFALQGGLRQRFVQRSGANVSAQFLVGFAGWSQRFSALEGRANSVSFFSLQPGMSIDVPLDERWAVRLRTDVRLATASGAESAKGAWSLGLGIGRYWGSR